MWVERERVCPHIGEKGYMGMHLVFVVPIVFDLLTVFNEDVGCLRDLTNAGKKMVERIGGHLCDVL